MIGFLASILCVLQNILLALQAVVIIGFNALIAGIAAVIVLLTTPLPPFPEAPALPAPMETALEWVAWFFPVATVVAILAFCVTAWLVWQIAAMALRWARMLND